jgi:peptide chain release factor subunit 3
VKIKVRGLEDEDIKKGFMVTDINEPCYITQEIEAELMLLNLPEHKSILSTGYMSVMHLHSAIEDAHISGIICSIENGKKIPNCSFLKSNMVAIVRIRINVPVSVEKYSDNPQLGSFTLRDEGLTIAMGKILRLKPLNKVPVVVK